jgi:transposase
MHSVFECLARFPGGRRESGSVVCPARGWVQVLCLRPFCSVDPIDPVSHTMSHWGEWLARTVVRIGRPLPCAFGQRFTRVRIYKPGCAMLANVSVGIDVAKRHLDLHLHPQNLRFRVSNDSEGHAQLLGRIMPQQPPVQRIVVESTGGYERQLVFALLDAHLPVALVNPAEVRSFARASGRRAKNDRLDAKLLAEFATGVHVPLLDQGCKIRHVLRQLVTRRRQLVDQCTQLRNHREHADLDIVRQSIDRSIRNVREELAVIEQAIQQHIDQNPPLKARQEKLLAAIGVGKTVSAILVSELPELGTLHRSKLASLVGVAPFDNDSGTQHGRRSIQGGRPTVRAALYMATLVACRHDPHLKAHYQQLLNRGKPKKVALVACMHKRLNYLNSLLRENTNNTDPQNMP